MSDVDTPTPGLSAYDVLYGPCASIDQRFPDLTGSLRYDAVEKAYSDTKNFTFRLFSTDGQPLLRRHPINNRRQAAVIQYYAKGVLQNGVMSNMRGAMMGIQDKNGCYLLIAAATLAEAIYLAHRMEPNNPHVQKVLRDGIPGGGVLFRENTPEDVIRWLAFEHNTFHHGSSYNVVEMRPGKLIESII